MAYSQGATPCRLLRYKYAYLYSELFVPISTLSTSPDLEPVCEGQGTSVLLSVLIEGWHVDTAETLQKNAVRPKLTEGIVISKNAD